MVIATSAPPAAPHPPSFSLLLHERRKSCEWNSNSVCRVCALQVQSSQSSSVECMFVPALACALENEYVHVWECAHFLVGVCVCVRVGVRVCVRAGLCGFAFV